MTSEQAAAALRFYETQKSIVEADSPKALLLESLIETQREVVRLCETSEKYLAEKGTQ